MDHTYYAAVLTLFDKEGNIDFQEQKSYYDFLLEQKVKGVFSCGTSGEYACLTIDEYLKMQELSIEKFGGKVPVIPCASSPSYFTTRILLNELRKIGYSEVAVCPPFYAPVSQIDIIDYYERLIDETGMTIYLYNIPSFTNGFSFETFKKLVTNSEIAGIKDSSGNMKTISRYIAYKDMVRPEFKVFTGTDEMILGALSMGCCGSVTACAGIVPEVHNLLYSECNKNLDLSRKLQNLITNIAVESENWIFPTGYKLALRTRGFVLRSFRQNVVEFGSERWEESYKKLRGYIDEALLLVKEAEK